MRTPPILMLSVTGRKAEARRAGVDAFLRQPEDFRGVAETAAGLLGVNTAASRASRRTRRPASPKRAPRGGRRVLGFQRPP
jgi:hypothetical protein